MKLLFLAPQPFFQERGTPIAVRLALQVLAERERANQEQIDLLTYNEGATIEIPGVRILRIPSPSWLTGIGPGVSLKKLLCDVIFTIYAIKLVLKQSKQPYNLVHAVEESVFVAWMIKLITGIPYIYDMDSALSLQLTEKWFLLRPFRPLLSWLEGLAIKGSLAVVPVCDALAVLADQRGSQFTSVLRDVSLLKNSSPTSSTNLRKEIGVSNSALLCLYIGNLESYQGIDLLLESFRRIAQQVLDAHLVLIGGNNTQIEKYRRQIETWHLAQRIFLIGPRPVSQLDQYIYEADILVSPRTRGNNTPMKIYSYLHSGKAILATRLQTHTQVLDESVALLVEAQAEPMAEGFLALLRDKSRRLAIGANAKSLAERKYTFDIFRQELNHLYDAVAPKITIATKVKATPLN